MIRVAVEATGVSPGGGLSLLRGALRALSNEGRFEIDVFGQRGLAEEQWSPNVRVVTVGPFHGLMHRMAWVQLRFPRLASGHNVIFSPGNLIPLNAGQKSVLFVQNAHVVPQQLWTAEYGRPKRRLQRLMARLSVPRAARVAFISEALKAFARPYWRANRLEPAVMHPGVTISEAPASVSPGRDVVVVGNMVPHKRLDRAVRGFAACIRSGADVGNLRIVGSPATAGILESVRRWAAREGVEDRVLTPGFLSGSELTRTFAEAGAYLSTSALEALPLPPLEALSLGVPAVVPDTAPFREVCGDAGIYFGQSDDEIGRGLASALESPAERVGLRRAALERARLFSWTEFSEGVGAAWASVAGA